LRPGRQSLCLRDLNGNAPFAKWTRAEAEKGRDGRPWRLLPEERGQATAEFLVLLDVGCKRPPVTVGQSGNRRTVKVAGQVFEFG
jgi:hypothetical protein